MVHHNQAELIVGERKPGKTSTWAKFVKDYNKPGSKRLEIKELAARYKKQKETALQRLLRKFNESIESMIIANQMKASRSKGTKFYDTEFYFTPK